MPIFILFIGSLLGFASVNGKIGDLFEQGKKDLFGDGQGYGFLAWAGAIIFLGALLRSVNLPDAGKALVALLILVFLLSNGGVLTSLEQQLKSIGGGGGGAGAGSSTTVAPDRHVITHSDNIGGTTTTVK